MITKLSTLVNIFNKNHCNVLKYLHQSPHQSSLLNHSPSLLTHHSKYFYLTPIQKPILSLAIQSIIDTSVQFMQIGAVELALPSEVSILVGGILFKIVMEIISKFFQNMKYQKHQQPEKNRYISHQIEKMFLVDLKRDLTFFEQKDQKYKEYKQYFRPGYLFAHLINSYLMLNFFRGCHAIITKEQFILFCNENSLLLMLSQHDPFFICPVIIIALNYRVLSRSRHPLLMHLVREENKLMCLNIAFMSGLVFVPMPVIYHFAYIGIAVGHLLLRMTRNEFDDVSASLKYIFNQMIGKL